MDIKKKLFFSDDSTDDESDIIPELTIYEKRKILPIGMVEVLEWRDVYQKDSINFDKLPVVPLVNITIPNKIIMQLKEIRETHHDEFGGTFIFNHNIVQSFEGSYGHEGTHDMDIKVENKLMFHTHPPYKSRLYSPPSEQDLGYIFRICVTEMKSLSHMVFAQEGIYVFFPNPILLHLSGKIKSNLQGIIDFVLKDSVQELRMLLGYTKEGIKYEPKITIDTFIERINQMGFYLYLYSYPLDGTDLICGITDNHKRYIVNY